MVFFFLQVPSQIRLDFPVVNEMIFNLHLSTEEKVEKCFVFQGSTTDFSGCSVQK